jgi:hypothetical protein
VVGVVIVMRLEVLIEQQTKCNNDKPNPNLLNDENWKELRNLNICSVGSKTKDNSSAIKDKLSVNKV